MQCKLKLNLGALIAIGFLVKIASVGGVALSGEKPITSISMSEHLEETKKLLSELRGLKEKKGDKKEYRMSRQ